MTALATSADVEAQLGRSLTSEEEERVEALLRAASTRARIRTGRNFTPGTYTSERTVRAGGRVPLPETVASVQEVRVVYTDGTTDVVDEDAWVLRRNTLYGLTYLCRVEVDYTVIEDVPEEIVDAVAAIVATRIDSPPAGLVESETIGSFSIRYRDGSTAVTSESEVFARWAAPSLGPINLLA